MNPLRTFIRAFGILFLLFAIGSMINVPYFNQGHVIFCNGSDFLADFINNVNYSKNLNPYFPPSHEHIYPPLAYLLLYPVATLSTQVHETLPGLYSIQHNAVVLIAALCFSFASAIVFVLLLRKFMMSHMNLLTLCFCCSGIITFSIERANLIWLAVIGVTLFLIYEESPSAKSKIVALIGISIATSLKIYPAIFLFLWLNKKDFKWFLGAVMTTAFLGFAPLAFIEHDPLSNAMQLLANATEQNKEYFKFYFNHSLTLPAYLVGTIAHFQLPCSPLDVISKLLVATFKLFGIVCIATAFLCKEKWMKMYLLAAALVFIPTITMHYTILYFLPAAACFLGRNEPYESCPNGNLIAISFAILLTPFQFFTPTIIGTESMHTFSVNPFVCGLVIAFISLYIVCLTLLNASKQRRIKRYSFLTA